MKDTIHGLKECLIHQHGIPHSITSDQEMYFIEKEMQQWVHAYRIHWSYHVPHHPEAAVLTEQPFEDSIIVLAGWPYLAGLKQGSSEGCLRPESVSNIWCYFSIPRIQGSRNQCGNGINHTINLSDILAKFLLPIMILHFAGLEILVLEGEMLPPGDTTVSLLTES